MENISALNVGGPRLAPQVSPLVTEDFIILVGIMHNEVCAGTGWPCVSML